MVMKQQEKKKTEERKRTITSMDADSYRSDNALRTQESIYTNVRGKRRVEIQGKDITPRNNPPNVPHLFPLPMHCETEAEADGKN